MDLEAVFSLEPEAEKHKFKECRTEEVSFASMLMLSKEQMDQLPVTTVKFDYIGTIKAYSCAKAEPDAREQIAFVSKIVEKVVRNALVDRGVKLSRSYRYVQFYSTCEPNEERFQRRIDIYSNDHKEAITLVLQDFAVNVKQMYAEHKLKKGVKEPQRK